MASHEYAQRKYAKSFRIVFFRFPVQSRAVHPLKWHNFLEQQNNVNGLSLLDLRQQIDPFYKYEMIMNSTRAVYEMKMILSQKQESLMQTIVAEKKIVAQKSNLHSKSLYRHVWWWISFWCCSFGVDAIEPVTQSSSQNAHADLAWLKNKSLSS